MPANNLRKCAFLLSAAIVLACAGEAFSQRGKIAGRVTNAETREPLIGTNVCFESMLIGAATDLGGYYYIINVPPGLYDIRAQSLGFVPLIIKDVIISSGRTTEINFELDKTFLEAEAVEVTYEKPPVDIQETSSRSVIRQEVLENIPVETVGQILELQAGASTDGSGELHLRGGRSGEIVYYVDGQRIENPITGESALFINREAVEELTLLSGTFNAEYGDAMSGVVNIITRDGGDQINASFEYLSPRINASPYRETDWIGADSDALRDDDGNSLYQANDVLDQPDNLIGLQGRYSLSLGGPLKISKNTHFFVSSLLRNENDYLPFGYEQERLLQGKITQSYGQGGKVTFSTGVGWKNDQNYSHSWKYVPDQYHKHFLRDRRFDLQWTHQLNRNAFFDAAVGYHYQQHDIKIFEDWQDYLDNGYQQRDFTFDFYSEDDWSDTYRESNTETFSIRANLNYQYGNHHLLKGGVEGRLIEIDMLDIRELVIGEDNQPSGIIDQYQEDPIEVAVYIQDKIELPYMVVNAGLRWDYVDPRTEGWSQPQSPDSGFAATEAAYQMSPRLGLAHPITEELSLYFAYGHFFQYPHYSNLFMNSADLNVDTLANRSFDAVGNRALNPQKTVAYEVGLKGNLTDVLGFTLTAFYKDITDLVGTKQVRVGTKYNYALFRNIDYASVIGVELGVRRNLFDNWSFEANYTYAVAKGNSSEPLEGFWNVYYEQPEAQQEYYLDFDRRHVLNAMFLYMTGKLDAQNKWMYPISDVTLGVTANWSSGLPYTPYTGAGEQLALSNSARMDPTATVDVRLSKTLLNSTVKVLLLATIENLFDFTNDLRVNSRTGEPWETTVPGDEIAFDLLHDPSKVDQPRIIQVGLSVKY
ncbi:MAG: TonB-dependent receptor [bacterium]